MHFGLLTVMLLNVQYNCQMNEQINIWIHRICTFLTLLMWRVLKIVVPLLWNLVKMYDFLLKTYKITEHISHEEYKKYIYIATVKMKSNTCILMDTLKYILIKNLSAGWVHLVL